MRRTCPNCQTAIYDDSKRRCYACLQELDAPQDGTWKLPEVLDAVPDERPIERERPVEAQQPVEAETPPEAARQARHSEILRYEELLQAERAARVELEAELRKRDQAQALLKLYPREPQAGSQEMKAVGIAETGNGNAGSPARVNRLLAGGLALALTTIVAQAVLPLLFRTVRTDAALHGRRIPALLPVVAQQDCPVRLDPAGPAHANTTLWIYEGHKATDASDALDADRSVTAACAVRIGSAAILHKATRVWRGPDPGLRDGFFATERVLPAGTTVTVTGALSGLRVTNGDGTFLHYEVWAPIAFR